MNVKGIGYRAVWSLVGSVGSPEAVAAMPDAELEKLIKDLPGLRRPMAEAIQSARSDSKEWLESAKKLLDETHRKGISIVTLQDSTYPLLLKRSSNIAPPLLFYKGLIESVPDQAVGIVGTRHPTERGRVLTQEAAAWAGATGKAVVSGMALGVDREAHLGALEAGAFTIAVLGCGVDTVYPPKNKDIYQRIAETGLVVSEYPPSTRPSALNLRRRNRTIVAFADSLIMAQGGLESGAMMAVQFSEEQRKPVYTFVPNRDELHDEPWTGPVMLLATRRAQPVTDWVDGDSIGLLDCNVFPTADEHERLASLCHAMYRNWLEHADGPGPEGGRTWLRRRIEDLRVSGWCNPSEAATGRIDDPAKPATRSSLADFLGRVAEDVKANLYVACVRRREELSRIRIRGVLFDLDGVLVDSRDALIHSLTEITGKSTDELKETVPSTGSPSQILKELLGDSYSPSHTSQFQTKYEKYLGNLARPHLGIPPSLAELASLGLKLGVVTSQPGGRAHQILRHTQLPVRQ